MTHQVNKNDFGISDRVLNALHIDLRSVHRTFLSPGILI
jgi:hypothetical protein